ncbi:hypothetical protein Pla110_32460 [Polystyrenella longa]|uniref:Uncharacterized protein n=1 Tax=Polystyrenella longa TaxID=2528007 RepID=A0A518CQM8_9PLAN|nr:hypothetical protein [Polystyrenella longa]QDU81504.1 hypothetical protein Pla110_32460 [Polystyrenella longa]
MSIPSRIRSAKFRYSLVVMCLALVGGYSFQTAVVACPFCSAPSLTLAEQVNQSDAVVLAEWQSSERGTADEASQTHLKIVAVVKQSDNGLKKGDEIVLNRFRSAEKGQKMLLLGTSGETSVDWDSPLDVSDLSYDYIMQAPAMEVPTTKRLEYYIQFLEFPEELVANDAYAEFANAPYEDIVPLADKMPREKLREWVLAAYSDDPQDQIRAATLSTRMGLYGLMLGLCGKDEDAKLLEEKITEQKTDFRLGIDGIMAGYLVLTKEDGLKVIEDRKLKPSAEVPFSETYSAMQAVRFMWNYGDERISKERLRQSMRILLERKELVDLVIGDLARWQDWSILDRLHEMYGAEGYEIGAIKRAIIRYYLSAIQAGSKDDADEDAQNVAAEAKNYLDDIREKDPKTVEQAERFFLLD